MATQPASSANGKELEASLATPEVLNALAEKVSGEKVPRIGAVKGGNLNTSQQSTGVALSESELALKAFDLLEQGSSFVDVIQRKADRTRDLRVKESHERLRKAFEVTVVSS